jgi:hypothetical protein
MLTKRQVRRRKGGDYIEDGLSKDELEKKIEELNKNLATAKAEQEWNRASWLSTLIREAKSKLDSKANNVSVEKEDESAPPDRDE